MIESVDDIPRDSSFERPHRRHDPLRDVWVLVSPGRDRRPWSGAVEAQSVDEPAAYDPACYLCPGNTRAGGAPNPAYETVHVFTNDFAALTPDAPVTRWSDGLLRAQGEPGTCRVVCFSPRHDVSLGVMPRAEVRRVIDTLADQTSELGARFGWVQVFENRGRAMGASNAHPHGQIWAGTAVPVEPARESINQQHHFARTGRRMLIDYAKQERGGPRVVVDNSGWLALVPFWAVWPFEILLLPKAPAQRLADLEPAARDALADAQIELVGRYDSLFGVPFPYSMGWHQAPSDGSPVDGWQLHAHYYPPLLRSASVRKFLVGYELLAEPQRDLTPEEAAAQLRSTG